MGLVPARATVHLPGGDGEDDLRPGEAIMVESDHPWFAGGYLVPEAQALADRGKDDLIEQAKALGITGTSSMNKDELVAAIEESIALTTEATAP